MAEFVRFVAARAPGGELPPLRHASDVWLAWACVQGAAEALAYFLRTYEPLITAVVRRRGADPDAAADIRQRIVERLLVTDAQAGRPAKIADYKGHGALRNWVASAAATTLSTTRRSEGRRREHAAAAAEQAYLVRADPEIQYLKERYGAMVHEAIVAAIDDASPRDKTLLRLHLKERLSVDALGAMYGVNRATAARWLAAARRALRARTLERLRSHLSLSPGEGESLLGLVNSQLEVSMLRHLEPGPERTLD